MIPLAVKATLAGAVSIPYHPIALDGLLAWAVTQRDGIPPATLVSEMVDVEIPIARESRGRFHLASCGAYGVEQSQLRYVNKRPPIEQYQTIGSDKIKRAQITAGPDKMYRIPMETVHLVDDAMRWWCIGDMDGVRDLLSLVRYLGKRRGVGCGRVLRWEVSPVQCADVWPGFPVTRGGAPMRTLPMDWGGLVDPSPTLAVLTYPYWDQTRETLCTVPARLA